MTVPATTIRSGLSSCAVPASGLQAGAEAVAGLLDRLVRQERETLRVMAQVLPPTFDAVMELYRASGFLYPAKLAALKPRLPAIERTWRSGLQERSRVLRVVGRWGIVDGEVRLRSAISAFAYAEGTWQGQHLVSRERREYTGTLAVLAELVEGLHRVRAPYIRLSFRPDNPGTNLLFGGVTERLSSRVHKLAVIDYGMAQVNSISLEPPSRPGVRVVRLDQDASEEARRFYARVLHPVELASLGLEDPGLRSLDARYRQVGLRRRRKVLVAREHGEIVGACLVHDTSHGLLFVPRERHRASSRPAGPACPDTPSGVDGTGDRGAR